MVVKGNLEKYNENTVPVNFVSVAVYVGDDKTPSHAAILIRHLSQNFLFHYPGNVLPLIVDLDNEVLDQAIVYKILDNFDVSDSGDVGAFLQHCKRVCKETDITYGFVLDGSSYGSDGRFMSLSGLPEISTCVGFCVNILANSIVDAGISYFKLEDWDDIGIPANLERWARQEFDRKYPSLDYNIINSYKKRISPLEYLGSGFCDEFPISKIQLAPILDEVNIELERII